MFSYVWPVALVVLSNVIYQICAKSLPAEMNPLASMTVTYLVGAVCSFALYFALNKDGNIIREYKRLNWAPFVLGLVVVGLEVGMLYAYKVGWQVSILSIVQSSFVAAALIFVGALIYKEQLTWSKLLGTVICLVGLYFINR